MPAKVQARGRELNSSGHVEVVTGGQFQLEHPEMARSFDVHFRRVVCNVQAAERFR
jgi:hypothetical protein